jgi:hypothetical protein
MSNTVALVPLWNIPYQRNEFFTGREDVLTHLHQELQVRNTAALTQPQGISGLGHLGLLRLSTGGRRTVVIPSASCPSARAP